MLKTENDGMKRKQIYRTANTRIEISAAKLGTLPETIMYTPMSTETGIHGAYLV
jgi:hypothetical protein